MDVYRRFRDIVNDRGIGCALLMSGRRVRRTIVSRERYLIFCKAATVSGRGAYRRDVDVIVLDGTSESRKVNALFEEWSITQRLEVHNHLANSGIIIAIVVNGERAHQSWVATSGALAMDPVASHIDYSGRAYIGRCETKPLYRGRGLYPYALSVICEHLWSIGLSDVVLSVSPDNAPSISGIKKAGFSIDGEIVFRKLFGVRLHAARSVRGVFTARLK